MVETFLILINIIFLEVVLSLDNAAVLATMARTLPKDAQKKALTYGILGAYLFRFAALLFAALLLKLTWLKVLGGVYLIYIGLRAMFKSESEKSNKALSFPFISQFWSTVIAIEFADIAFSLDNVFAVVALTEKMELIYFGVFVGILAMRVAATHFIKLIENFPVLEKVANAVVAVLGLKLILSTWLKALNLEEIDLVFSILVIVAFISPILYKVYLLKNEK